VAYERKINVSGHLNRLERQTTACYYYKYAKIANLKYSKPSVVSKVYKYQQKFPEAHRVGSGITILTDTIDKLSVNNSLQAPAK